MKKIIRLTESDIKKIVMEAVSELKYGTYKNAYDKMVDYNQPQRASDFNDSFREHYNDDDTTFNLASDTLNIGEPNARTKFFRDGSMVSPDAQSGGQYFSDAAGNRDMFPRTSNRKLARSRANKLNFFNNNDSTFTKNDFISEAIDRVFKKMFR